MKIILASLLVVALGGFWYVGKMSAPVALAESPAVVPAVPQGAQVITLGFGCFWRTEEIFRQVPGVVSVTVGYMGGTLTNSAHELVTSSKTGEAEVARVVFDPTKTSLTKILQVFWAAQHPNQSASGSGRSVIFYSNIAQQKIAEDSKAEAAKSSSNPIVTQIEPAGEFVAAEEFHQNYYGKGQGQCSLAVSPQLRALGIK